MIDDSGLSDAEALANLQVSWGFRHDEDADPQSTRTVAWRQLVDSATPPVDDEPEDLEPFVGSTLLDWLDDPTIEVVEVRAVADRHALDDQGSYQHQIELAMVGGGVSTHGDAREVRSQFLASRGDALAPALDELADIVQSHGGKVLAVAPGTGVLRAQVTVDALLQLLDHPLLAAIDEVLDQEDDGGWMMTSSGRLVLTTTDGGQEISLYELTDLVQSDQFYDRGYFGDGETAVVTEGGADRIRDSHPGFRVANHTTSRVSRCEEPTSGHVASCTTQGQQRGMAHATGVAAILAGDTTQGQDPALACVGLMCEERSGVARQAEVIGLSSTIHERTFEETLIENDYLLLNTSFSESRAADPECKGKNSLSQLYNALYESGLALFKSAGNRAHEDSADCRVGSPGSAIGVFTVGGWQLLEDDSNPLEVLYEDSSLGGTSQEGRGRTIIDIAAPTRLNYRYQSDALAAYWHGEYTNSTGTNFRFGGTSASAPVVTGSAALFRNWWHDTLDDGIDDPGLLYTNLLLMGDRSDEGQKLTTGYSNTWGAGKLRLRAWDDMGMDTPAAWEAGSTCVGEAHDVVIPITSNLSSNVDELRVVAWFYDPRHDRRKKTDDVDLYIDRLGDSTWRIAGFDQSSDNKHRIHLNDLHPWSAYRIRLDASDVRSDGWEDHRDCGRNHVRVYWAWYYEDDARDDPNDHTCEYVRTDSEFGPGSCP